MAQRPTPRNGWTAVANASDKPEGGGGTPILKRAPSAAETTISFAKLPPLSAARFAPGALPGRAEPPAALPAVQRRLVPPAPPAGRPSAASTPAATPAAVASSPVDSTEDVSLQDVAVADVGASDADHTQDVSLSEVAAEENAPAPGPKLRTRVAFAVGTLLTVLGGGWFALARMRAPAVASTPTPPAAVSHAEQAAQASAAPPASAPVQAPPVAGSQPPSEAAPSDETPPAAAPTAQAPEGAADEAAQQAPESAEGARDDAQPGDPELAVADKAAMARADKLVEQGRGSQKRKHYPAAKAHYREALSVYPEHPGALTGLIQLALQKRDGKQAVLLAKQLVQVQPDEPGNLVLLGDAYKRAGKRKEAREAWQSAARQGSTAARARLKH